VRGASAAALGVLLLVAGCGGGAAATGTRAPIALTAAERHGKELFVGTCGSCHTLADAGTTGDVGPDLDAHPWRRVYLGEVIADGPGLMPGGLLAGRDADDVAAYVAAATRR
jgi:mono/diheme cytochrome c family protein